MITTINGLPYTWDTADFTWNSAAAGKTWDNAAPADYTLAPAETITLTPAHLRAPHLPISETARLTSRTCRRTTHTTTAALTAAPALIPRTDYRRTAHETAALWAADTRHHLRRHTDRLTLTDRHLTPWQGILSNITLLTDSLTDENWTRISTSPNGYEAFHPFEVGEYTYRDALIRVLLTTGAAGTDPLLYDLRFHVDIEDTRESGTAECTADEPTHITLTRRYHHTPRILLTVLSANAQDGILIPRLISQNTEGDTHTFDCELLRTDGTRTNGTISWMAEGY